MIALSQLWLHRGRAAVILFCALVACGLLSFRTTSLQQRSLARNSSLKPVIHERAFVTLIASAEYDVGAQIVVCRLRSFSPDIPIFVLVDESVRTLHSAPFYNNMGVTLVAVRNPVRDLNAYLGWSATYNSKLSNMAVARFLNKFSLSKSD